MQIAIFSDSHDNLAGVDRALAAAKAADAQALLHCGDLCAPFVLDRLVAGFAGPIHVVFGNNDGDGRLLQTIAQKYPQIHLHGIYAEVTLGGIEAGLIHYPEPALRIAQSGRLDLVAYGHNHMKKVEIVENSVDKSCVLVNPGEILGMRGKPTVAFYNSATRVCELEELGL
ncbi:MAG: metallophosphoesterase family protein [Litorilinea sp.]